MCKQTSNPGVTGRSLLDAIGTKGDITPEPLEATSTTVCSPKANGTNVEHRIAINAMEVVREGNTSFFLFLDIFVHPSRRKIVAVAPYYDQDWDPENHGVNYEQVYMEVEGLRIRARYIPHRLDSFEPCILFDFEDPALGDLLTERDEISFTISVGPHSKTFCLATRPAPAWNLAMSLVVRNENRWIPTFLEYYLSCLEVEHVFVYDNRTSDQEGLLKILRPYQEQGRVTYIPWSYRWRNHKNYKMIAQPPQQAHSLNRFANTRWIGFFDVDELLRIPNQTLPEFLAQHEHAAADGLSFGIRWFDYCGPKNVEEIADPPLTFLHGRRDKLGRKRQKLIVAPHDVRFLRLHWLEEGKRELAIDETDIYFHHYSVQHNRLEKCKAKPAVFDDYMLRFADRLAGLSPPRRESGTRSTTREQLPRPTDADQWIAHILDAIEAAETGAYELPPELLAVEGMSGIFNRRFYNRLCAFDGCRYLEIGSLNGASLCAATYGNRITATCIDNWSHLAGTRARFENNVARFRGDSTIQVIEQDCFQVDTSMLGPFDVYLYDGDHAEHSQRQALVDYSTTLAPLAVVVVDDWNWEQVRRSTRKTLDELPVDVLFEKEILLPERDTRGMPRHNGKRTWWNGICILLLASKEDNC